MNEKSKKRVCLGAFAGAHGVKGAALVKTFTEKPENIAAYGPVETEDGERRFTLSIVRRVKSDVVLATAPEIQNREDAQSLKGEQLYIDRDRLPRPDQDEFYFDDLIGLVAVDEAGAPLGRISAVYNFGAGDLIELQSVRGSEESRIISFSPTNVLNIDIADGALTIRRAVLEEENEAD